MQSKFLHQDTFINSIDFRNLYTKFSATKRVIKQNQAVMEFTFPSSSFTRNKTMRASQKQKSRRSPRAFITSRCALTISCRSQIATSPTTYNSPAVLASAPRAFICFGIRRRRESIALWRERETGCAQKYIHKCIRIAGLY